MHYMLHLGCLFGYASMNDTTPTCIIIYRYIHTHHQVNLCYTYIVYTPYRSTLFQQSVHVIINVCAACYMYT